MDLLFSHLDFFIDVFSMTDTQHPYFLSYNFEYNAVVSNSEFPVSLQGAPKRPAITLRFNQESFFNSSFDELFGFTVQPY